MKKCLCATSGANEETTAAKPLFNMQKEQKKQVTKTVFYDICHHKGFFFTITCECKCIYEFTYSYNHERTSRCKSCNDSRRVGYTNTQGEWSNTSVTDLKVTWDEIQFQFGFDKKNKEKNIFIWMIYSCISWYNKEQQEMDTFSK